MDDLTAFQRDILYVIQAQNAPNGLEIKAEMEAYYGEEINHGRLYPNLDTLTDAGLVTKGEYDKRTNKYGLTPQGKQAIQTRMTWEQAHVADLIAQPLEMDEEKLA